MKNHVLIPAPTPKQNDDDPTRDASDSVAAASRAEGDAHSDGEMKNDTRACAECHRTKNQCVYNKPGQQKQEGVKWQTTCCERCVRLGKECIPHSSREGERNDLNCDRVSKNNYDDGSVMEEKIEAEALEIIEKGRNIAEFLLGRSSTPKSVSKIAKNDVGKENGKVFESEDNINMVEILRERSDKMLGSKARNINYNSSNKNGGRGIYYAVRVGYALPSVSDDGDDDDDSEHFDENKGSHPNKKRKGDTGSMAADSVQYSNPVKIKSAIFLYWDDASHFVDAIHNNSPEYSAEYAAFNTFQEAEDYLLQAEKERARNVATAAELAFFASTAKKNKKLGRGDLKAAGIDLDCLVGHQPAVSQANNLTSQQNFIPPNPLFGMGLMNPFFGNMLGGFFGNEGMGAMVPWGLGFGSMLPPVPLAATVPPAFGQLTNNPSTIGPTIVGQPVTLVSPKKIKPSATNKEEKRDEAMKEHDENFGETNKPTEEEKWMMNMLKSPAGKPMDQAKARPIVSEQLLNILSPSQICQLAAGEEAEQEGVQALQTKRRPYHRVRGCKCEGCLREDCGECRHCLDKPKFGGRGTTRQRCIERRCRNKIKERRNNAETKNESDAPAKPKKRKNINRFTWWDMFQMLEEYKKAHNGSIEIPEMPAEEKDKPGVKELEILRKWCKTQIAHCRSISQGHTISFLDASKVQKLKEIGLKLPPSYDEMYEKLVAHKAETGTLDVNEDEDEELFKWIKEQKKFLAQHFTNINTDGNTNKSESPLSDERIQNLLSLGYELSHRAKSKVKPADIADKGSLDAKWESMFESLVQYKEDHGVLTFGKKDSELPKEVRSLKHWVRAQRAEFSKLEEGQESTLTARRLHRLTSLGINLNTKREYISWEERMKSLREFAAEHGHCKISLNHPTLGGFTSNLRSFYNERLKGNKSCLTDERIRDLEEIGFVFRAGKTPNHSKVFKTWEERFQELVAYKEEHGHTLVPQKSGPLGQWVKEQRTLYRRMKKGVKTPMTAEKALRLKEIGFLFDAANWKGRNRFERNARNSSEGNDMFVDQEF